MNDEIAEWSKDGPFTHERSESLREKIRAITPRVHAGSPWNHYLLLHYAVLLHKTVNIVESCHHWRERIETERKNEKPARKPSATILFPTLFCKQKKNWLSEQLWPLHSVPLSDQPSGSSVAGPKGITFRHTLALSAVFSP